MKRRYFYALAAICMLLIGTGLRAADDTVSGLYKAVLQHENSKFYQNANITLRTIQTGGQLKVSATVKVVFGEPDSNEYITYEYDDVQYNFITGQIAMKSEKNDVILKGILRPSQGTIEGEWTSSVLGGRVGPFSAKKGLESPKPPVDGILVKTLTGHYRGKIVNTNPQSNIPERVTVSLVTTQEITTTGPVLKVSGNTRLYLGDFDSLEYIEIRLSDIQFNFYNRFLTMKTAEYGLTFKGYMSHDGAFKGKVYADGIGEAGTTEFKQYP